MKIVIQRVSKAKVESRGEVIAEINKGILVLVGFAKEDKNEIAKKMAEKILKLRIFPDEHRDINRSILDIKGEVLVVSQFTLLADTSAGNRPSFIKAADPKKAKELFDLFILELRKSGLSIKTGLFGEYMKVYLINEGPVTIVY
jgi:D-tyrosyl-tRNA(Tyr) deacylase